MRAWAKVYFGVIPACLQIVGVLMFANLISTTRGWLLLASGLIGTSGLIWSLTNYSRKSSPALLVMLCIGIVGMTEGGVRGALYALEQDAYTGKLGSSGELALRIIVVSWLILSPVLVGLFQAHRAVQVFRASA